MNKFSGALLVGVAAVSEPVFAASPVVSPYGETTQYIDPAGGNDLLTTDNLDSRCSVTAPLAPIVLRASLDTFNQGLLASATVTSSEREAYVKEQARKYIDAKSELIEGYLNVVKQALEFYNNTPTIGGKYEKPFIALDYSLENPKALLLRASKYLGYVEDVIKEIDSAEIKADDKAVFEQSIKTSLETLQQLGISCEPNRVGPLKMYPGRDGGLLGYDLSSRREVAAYTPRVNHDDLEIDKFAEEQTLRWDVLHEMGTFSRANFLTKYGISELEDSAQ